MISFFRYLLIVPSGFLSLLLLFVVLDVLTAILHYREECVEAARDGIREHLRSWRARKLKTKKGKLKASSTHKEQQARIRPNHHSIEDLRADLRTDIAYQQAIADRQVEIERELGEIIAVKEARVAALRAMNVADRERMKAKRVLALLDFE